MELLCPECLGPLVTRDGRTATCTLHGGEYRILFLRGQLVAPPAPRPPIMATPPAMAAPVQVPGVAAEQPDNPFQAPTHVVQMCVRHTGVEAQHNCAACGVPICMVCTFPQPDGTQLCPTCVGQGRVYTPLAGEDFSGVMCARHPAVQAVQRCTSCRQPVCATCDFALPGSVHVCPDCATKSDERLSSSRKMTLGWAYALVVWCTLALAVLFSGALATMASDPDAQNVLGAIMWIGLFIPSLIGTALSLSSLDRRLRNPPVIWVAVIWNVLVIAILILLEIVGLVTQQ